MTIVEAYQSLSVQLEDEARAYIADGDMPKAKEAMLAALTAYSAGRAELKNPDNPPVMCHNCGGEDTCDIAAHEARREVWHLA